MFEAVAEAGAGRGAAARAKLVEARALDLAHARRGVRRAALALVRARASGASGLPAALEGLQELSTLGELPPGVAPLYLAAAIEANQAGDLPRFSEMMGRAQELDPGLAPDPTLVNTWLIWGRELAAEGREREAVSVLTKAMAWADGDMLLGDDHLLRLAEGGWIERMVVEDPDGWAPYVWRSVARLAGARGRREEVQAALDDLERALAHPGLPPRARSRVLHRRHAIQHRLDPAGTLARAQALQAGGQIDPRLAARAMGEALAELGRKEEALEWYRTQVQLTEERIAETREERLAAHHEPISDGAHRMRRDLTPLIKLLAELKRFAEARELLARMVGLSAKEHELGVLEAHLLVHEGKQDEALALVERLLAKDPDRRELIRLRASLKGEPDPLGPR